LLNAAFAIAILDLISQVHLPLYVNMLPNYLNDSTYIYMYIYIYTHTYICIYTYMYIYIYKIYATTL
jgi:hypothetical protein